MIRASLFLLFICLFCSNAFAQQEKLVNDFVIEGNSKIKTAFIKKIAKIETGAVLDSLSIQEDIKRLKRLPAVSHAYYQVFHSHENKYNVFYHIEENFTIIPSLNIYTTNDGEFAYRLGIADFNLFGRNIIFGGYYQKDIFSSYGLYFRAPYLFNRQFGLAINQHSLTTQEPVFFNNTTANYKYTNTSIEALGLYEINFKNRIELGINLFSEDYNYLNGATAEGIPQALEVKKMLYKAIYEFNNLDYQYHYVSGFKSQFNFQYVIARNSDAPHFQIGWNDFSYYKRVGKKGNWASRLRFGLATNDKSPFSPFSVDNNVNLRGVGNTIDRGTGTLVLNTEFRYTLIEKGWFVLQGNSFIDIGTWRNPGGEFSDFTKSENVRVYPGLGLRIMHKKIYNAIFRIDYGVGITKNATRGIVFGIGQYF